MMTWSAPSALARASFSSLDEVTITAAPAAWASCSAKIETPPVPSVSTVSPPVTGRGPCKPPNEPWDRRFLERLLALEIESFDDFTDDMIDREAGFGGHEVRTWVAAAAALKAATAVNAGAAADFGATLDYYHVIPEWLTGMAVVRGAPKLKC